MAVPDAVDDGHCDCTEKRDVLSEHRDESPEHRDEFKLKEFPDHRDESKVSKVITNIERRIKILETS